jgi:hypothetical protein
MNWHEKIAEEIGSHHSDTLAVVRGGKTGAKRRTNRHRRQNQKAEDRADLLLALENAGLSDSWYED